jgi:hypothetical protein
MEVRVLLQEKIIYYISSMVERQTHNLRVNSSNLLCGTNCSPTNGRKRFPVYPREYNIGTYMGLATAVAQD